MLEAFLSGNRETLIARCRSKVAARRAPQATEHELWYGVPLFLDQLIEALRQEHASGSPEAGTVTPNSSEIGTTAARHGNELLRKGFTVGQVVHDYGDLCQAITETAMEQNATLSAAEFRTLNGCLDHAIAGAVSELPSSPWGRSRPAASGWQAPRVPFSTAACSGCVTSSTGRSSRCV